MRWTKVFAIAILAQVIFLLVSIVGNELLNRFLPGYQAWHAAFPLFVVALFAEAGFLRLATGIPWAKMRNSLGFFICLSWVLGVMALLLLTSSSKEILGRLIPVISFALSAFVLVLGVARTSVSRT